MFSMCYRGRPLRASAACWRLVFQRRARTGEREPCINTTQTTQAGWATYFHRVSRGQAALSGADSLRDKQ